MLVGLYNLITSGYFASIKIAAYFSLKARLWVSGRRGLFERLETEMSQRDNRRPLYWMHCASLGEFEQGRPVLKAIKEKHPSFQILLTFFSPSGYEIRKNEPLADWVFYLPTDSASNAARFLDTVQPSLAIFVKYEFWYHYLHQMKQRGIAVYLIAAIFREKHPFFKWYGTLHRTMLNCFTKIFVQDDASFQLVSKVTQVPVLKAGDTRVDRVMEIAQQQINLPLIQRFCGNSPVLVCGSTWPADEPILKPAIESAVLNGWKVIIAPHDIQPARLHNLEMLFPGKTFRNSDAEEAGGKILEQASILIMDNIGMLSKLYRYGKVAYIGGGFGQGIHNTLEAIVYGIPVIFGPNYHKFAEAEWLVTNGGGFAIKDKADLIEILSRLGDSGFYETAGAQAQQYIHGHAGATAAIMIGLDLENRDKERPAFKSNK